MQTSGPQPVRIMVDMYSIIIPPLQDNEQHLPTAPYVCNMSSQKVLTVPSLLYFVTGGQSCWYDANLIIRQSAKEIDVLKKF